MAENTRGAVAARIKEEAARKGVSQAELGHRAGLNQQAVSRRLTGDVPINVLEAEIWADALGVSVAWLFAEAEAEALEPV